MFLNPPMLYGWNKFQAEFAIWRLRHIVRDTRTFEVLYTEAIVRDAVRTFVRRRGMFGQKGLWAAEVSALCVLAWLVWRGDDMWLTFIVSVVAALPPCLIVLMWIAHHRNTVGKFHRMRNNFAKFAIGDEIIAVSSDLGAAQIPWSTISEIWERPDYWMLFTAPNQFMTLPIETVPLADRDYLRSKVSVALSVG